MHPQAKPTTVIQQITLGFVLEEGNAYSSNICKQCIYGEVVFADHATNRKNRKLTTNKNIIPQGHSNVDEQEMLIIKKVLNWTAQFRYNAIISQKASP